MLSQAWVVDAVAGKHPVYAEDPARALAGFLTHELDTTAKVIPGAATMYGFIPGMEEAASALEAVIAEVAPTAPAPPAAQRGCPRPTVLFAETGSSYLRVLWVGLVVWLMWLVPGGV